MLLMAIGKIMAEDSTLNAKLSIPLELGIFAIY
jgi:hypothetical protein